MNEATQRFVRQHADDDVRMLALRGSTEPGIDMVAALQQIQGRQTARHKLPSWARHEDLLFPPHLAMEQCSSEQAAQYKAAVVATIYGAYGHSGAVRGTLIDLTGGFGVDFSFLAPLFTEAVYVERKEELCHIARHNFHALGLENTTVVCGDGTDYLERLDSHASLIFIDPARRDNHGARTYGMADCTPDVMQLLPLLLDKADHIMLKLSPMLDWRKTIDDLGRERVRQLHIVSVGGECKELLVVLSRQGEGLRLVCENDGEQLEWTDDETDCHEETMVTAVPTPPFYLYEPNASVMKAGCFALLGKRFGVAQIARNSHLFVAQHRIAHFPGREFCISSMTTMNKQELRQALAGIRQANITVRNFPLTVADLRKRLKLADGGSTYILATTLGDGTHKLLVGNRLNSENTARKLINS